MRAHRERHGRDVSRRRHQAANIDTSRRHAEALPIFLAVVVGLALVLLTIAFRTILVPLSSIAGFILSVFAAARRSRCSNGVGARIFSTSPRRRR
ncbi:hypothetical protein ACFYT3_06185 [Nocardia amikacinitolerans]|uniref:hypothetical protein n=1 Tax=Nocardia amikacinitolerans TaxID=756689 RepID=UPI0036A26370